MLPLFLLITAEIVGLWLLSQRLTKSIYTTFLLLFRHRSVAVSAITLILFPGTVIHELSHLFTAEILGVKTGKLDLAPESIEEEGVQVGSVELRQTDPFRRSAIGLAPFFVGLTALIGLSWILPNLWNDAVLAYNHGELFSSFSLYLCIALTYLLFVISNTMFSSAEDMKGVVPLAIVLGILGASAYTAGLRIGITGELFLWIQTILRNIAQSLGVVIIVNGIILILTTIFLSLTGKNSMRIKHL